MRTTRFGRSDTTRLVAHDSSSHPSELTPRAGGCIINARGVPGTIACLARLRLDDRVVLLASHHVLFGAGARARDEVSVRVSAGAPSWSTIGHTLQGRFGPIEHEQLFYHVDCAVASVDRAPREMLATLATENERTSLAWATLGETVHKFGITTGRTTGIVADIAYSDVVAVDGRPTIAPRQLVIRSTVRGSAFSAAGDSGALVRNARGECVAMLSGITPRGDSVACHLVPVFHVLHLRP